MVILCQLKSRNKIKLTLIAKAKYQPKIKCIHKNRMHYSKGLCRKYYNEYGRAKKRPLNCEHSVNHARGYCNRCYTRLYKAGKLTTRSARRKRTAIH